jgi:hypothetical protein
MHIQPVLPNTASAEPSGRPPVLGLAFDCDLSIESHAQSAGQFSTDLRIGAGQISSAKSELDELRFRCHQQDDLTTDIDYFLSCKDPRNCRPMVLILRNGSRPAAAFLFHEVCFVWLGTGVCGAGDSAGEGLLIAPASERELFLKRALHELVKVQKRFHTARFRLKTSGAEILAAYQAPGVSSKLVEGTVRHTLPLAETYSNMMASFGLRTRRSLRTKRRQLEDALQPDFFPGLAPELAFDVMRYLRPRSSSKNTSMWHFESRRKFLHSHPDAFAMALRSQAGIWLSVLCGWRRNETTYVDLQMNHSEYKRESLSAVMRAFLLEHEIGAGMKYITFVGGCSALLERYCRPPEAVLDLLVIRSSMRSWCLRKAIGGLCDRSFNQWIYLQTSQRHLVNDNFPVTTHSQMGT